MNIRLKIFQDITLDTDAIITVRGEDFDLPGEEPDRIEELCLLDHKTIESFWSEVLEFAKELRNENLNPILDIQIPVSEVLND